MTLNPTNHNITANAGTTLTVAQVLGGYITRTGSSSSDFVDTLPPTADILAALGAQTPFVLRIVSAAGANGTLGAADANTTITYGPGMQGNDYAIYADAMTDTLFTPNGDTLDVLVLFSYRSNF